MFQTSYEFISSLYESDALSIVFMVPITLLGLVTLISWALNMISRLKSKRNLDPIYFADRSPRNRIF